MPPKNSIIPIKPKIPFVAKRPDGAEPWTAFGSSVEDYNRWAPEICAMACCRSLILAKHAQAPTLWELTQAARRLGVYKENADRIMGAYHKPLAILLDCFGIEASLLKNVSEDELWRIADQSLVILSVNLDAIGSGLSGSHLVLVVGCDTATQTYLIHDNAKVLCAGGESCRISRQALAAICNGKGLLIQL